MGSIRRLPSGRWQARWRPPGARALRGQTFTRRRDAQAFLASVEGSKATGTYRDPAAGRIPLGPYLERFPQTADVRPATRALYEVQARRYVLPVFAESSIGEITPGDVREWLSGLQAGARTVQVAHQVLSRVLRQAVADGLIVTNPCMVARPPSVERPDPRLLSTDDVERLGHAIDERYRAMVLLAGWGGLRFGECAGLRTDHLRLLERKIDVREAATEVRGQVSIGPLKTRESRRTITVPAFLADALAEHLAHAGPPDLVFPAPGGGPLRRTNFRRRYWEPACEAVGLDPAPRFHDLRHHAAAVAIAAGAHPKAIQARLGHASITTTLNVYGGLFPSLDEELADRLDAARPAVVARTWHAEGADVVPIERSGP
jgi:integrase